MTTPIQRFCAVIVLALMAIVPLVGTRGGFQYSHDNFRYPVLLNQYDKQLLAEGFPVRWLPDLAGGHGYPTFVYYAQGYFLLASGFKHAFGLSDVTALYATIWVCLFVGGLAMYFVGRRLSGNVDGGVMSSAVFLLAPWMTTDVLVRGDYAESSALCVGTITILTALALADEDRSRPRLWLRVAGPIAFAAPLICHPMGGAMAAIVAAVAGLARCIDRPRTERSWAGLFIAMAGGFAMCAWYLIPLVAMQDLVHLERTTEGYYRALNHVIEPTQLIAGRFGYGGSTPGPGDEMAYALGLPVFIAVFFGFRQGTWVARATAILCVAVSLIMARPFGFLYADPSPLVKLQFSWRLVGLTLLAAATAAAACGRIQDPRRRKLIALLIVLIAAFQPSRYGAHPRTISINEAEAIVKQTVATLVANDERYAGSNEFDIKGGAILPPRGSRSLVTDAHGALPYSTNGSELRFTASRDQGADIRVEQYHFPGWRVTVDGVPLPATEKTADGFVRVTLPAGPPANVTVRYERVPLDKWLLPLALVTPAIALLLSWPRRRTRILAEVHGSS